MSESEREREALFQAIDREAEDPREGEESKIIYDALAARKGELGGSASIPADDPELTDSIREAATRRSEELRSGSEGVSSKALPMQQDDPVQASLWMAWAVAIVVAGVLLYFLW